MTPAGLGDWFSRSVGFPLIVNGSWRRSKDRRRFLRLLDEKLASQYWPLERLRAYQLDRLRRLLAHAGQHVPYYRDLFRSVGFDPAAMRDLADVQVVPPLTRAIIQAQQPRLMSEDAARRAAFKANTGGSTGIPMAFWQDAETRDYAEAAEWLSDFTAGRRMGSRTAYLWGRRLAPDLKARLRDRLRNQRWYNVYDMSEAKLRAAHRAMEAAPPEVLVGYASSLILLAHWLEARHLRPNYPRLALIPTADMLDEAKRALLQRVFGAPIFNRYGSSEVILLAYECEQHCGMHLNLPDNYVECLGADVTHEPGEVLVTHLNNYSMPLIRYQVDDLALMSAEACSCGRSAPLVRQVVGRSGLTIVAANGALIHGYYFDIKLRKVPGVREFQLVQEDLRHLRVRVVPMPAFALENFAPVQAEVRRLLGDDCRLTIELVDHIPLGPSGKASMLISRLPTPFSAERAV